MLRYSSAGKMCCSFASVLITNTKRHMIKRLLLISTVCFSLIAQAANLDPEMVDTVSISGTTKSEQWLHRLEPTYLRNVTLASGFRDNWFVTVGGGVSAFAGSPLGCEDLFGRIKPTLNVQVGKWFTPAIGARVSFQGFELKNSDLQTTGYKLAHADLMFDVAGYFNKARDEPRWGVVPYVGLGLIHNEDNGNSPLCFSYGLMGRYRLTQRLHLSMELGGTTTFKDFDGRGASREFGDNLMSITAGLSVTLGKNGWKKVVDAKPYMKQNDWLMAYSHSLDARHKQDAKALAEMRKILEIEGLLDYYSGNDGKHKQARTYPKNDYNGLNSLMARIGKGKDFISKSHDGSSHKKQGLGDGSSTKPSDGESWNEYLLAMNNNRECIGSPIYFFFKIDTSELTDRSQLINLDEIARVAKKYDLRIRITGAADDATGTETRNNELSGIRAQYIYKQLVLKGLNADYIAQISVGGINDFKPIEGNRFTKVELFFEPNN